jgi:hypothetical protein
MERGPAGNTSLTAAIALAQGLDREQILVVQETEYTAAGKLPSSQLTFAKQNGVEVKRGDPRENVPGKRIVIPENLSQINVEEYNMEMIRKSYLKNIDKIISSSSYSLTKVDIEFLAKDIKSSTDFIIETLNLNRNEKRSS